MSIIKTITCHDVYNFGASLQAYALMKYLQNLNHQVEIIDYKPKYLTYSLWSIGKRWNGHFITRFLYFSYVIPRRLLLKSRRHKFDLFTKEELYITPRRYFSNDDLKANTPLAEIYFAGSDQIWNVSHDNGKDPAFYLDFVPDGAIRASYAASFSISQIPEEFRSLVKTYLKRFDAVSVREKSGLRILESLNIKGGRTVLDPVFLLERGHWDHLSMFKSPEKYIFIYDQENNPIIRDTAIKIAKARNLKIYAIKSLYPFFYAHKKITDAGPREFLGLIKNCEVCLTNSFHATAFSIIFQKEFFTFKRTHEKVNSRMIDLLGFLQISDRIVDDFDAFYACKALNYNEINMVLLEEIKSSKNYICSVIKKLQNK